MSFLSQTRPAWQRLACTRFHACSRDWRFCCQHYNNQLSAQWSHWVCAVFLVENIALKFDVSGVERRRKHDIFKSQYQLGEFHNLYKIPPDVLSTAQCGLQRLIVYCRLELQHISHISTNFQKTIPELERLFVTLR
jgi:hypothetical protein